MRIGSASGLHEIAVHETGSGTPLGAYTVTPSVPATTAVVPLSPVPHSTSLTITITALGSTPGALDTITFYLPRDTTVPTNIASNVCTGGGYRYGYNGQMKDNEISGVGNHYTALYGDYDSRIGTRWNPDPKPSVGWSRYSVFFDNPIFINDVLLDSPGRAGGNTSILDEMKKNAPKHPDFKSPKNGDQKVKNPNGQGAGWKDKGGNVWVPTDHKGTHAPHWDVEHPDGTHTNIYSISDEPQKKKSPQLPTLGVPAFKPKVYSGYPGQGIGELLSKGIEYLTGKKIPIPDPVIIPVPAPVTLPIPSIKIP